MTRQDAAEEVDCLVIGGGPSGLSFAHAAAAGGLKRVLLIERQAGLGGVPRHCGHSPFGMREFGRVLDGATYAKRLADRARDAGARLLPAHAAVRLGPDGSVDLATPDGPRKITARAIVLATGTREATRAARLLPGRRLRGILNTGALQDLVYLRHMPPFSRPLIVGSELVSLSALLTCRSSGMRPVAMIDDVWRTPHLWPAFRAARLLGVPFLVGTSIADIRGTTDVTSVVLERGDRRWEVACDGIVLSGRFTPEASLARSSAIPLDPVRTGPRTDHNGRTERAGVYAIGNAVGTVRTAGQCWSEGRRVARIVLAQLGA